MRPRIHDCVVGASNVNAIQLADLVGAAAGLSRGARASVVAAVGCTLGIVPHMVAAITGLAALLHTSALAFQVLK